MSRLSKFLKYSKNIRYKVAFPKIKATFDRYYMVQYKAILSAILIVSFCFALVAYNQKSDPISVKQDPQPNNLDLTCGFTEDFSKFLKEKGYSSWNFERGDLKCGAFGGKANASDKISKTPVIFIHGNSDIGFGRGKADGYASWQTGFRQLATYLGTQDYAKAQLYTTTWGSANPDLASLNNHAKKYVLEMRAFVEAVLAYTGAPQVSIVTHSMGVTIGRKIIKGGKATDRTQGTYDVGSSLKSKVKTFVGIAGGNLGLTGCHGLTAIPTCSEVDGFNPGLVSTSGPSKYLTELNNQGGTEATNVYAIWSRYDEVITLDCVVWGKVTCRIPGQQQEIVKNSVEWTHIALRDKTGPDMIKWL